MSTRDRARVEGVDDVQEIENSAADEVEDPDGAAVANADEDDDLDDLDDMDFMLDEIENRIAPLA